MAGGPAFNIGKGALSIGAWSVLLDMGEFQREVFLIQRIGNTVFPNDGKGFAPVALAAEGGIPMRKFVLRMPIPFSSSFLMAMRMASFMTMPSRKSLLTSLA